jgi:type IV pilus assembly protein PilW
MTPHPGTPHPARRRQGGLSLIELVVALSIGLFLIGGVITVFGKTRDLYRTNDSAARMQETARYAISAIEADLRTANYWGLHNRPELVDNAPALDLANLPAPDPGYALPGALAAYAATISACGNLWAVKLAAYVEGTDGDYGLACAPFGAAVAGADQLTIRRADTGTIAAAALGATNGQLKIQTSRAQGTLFAGTALPAGYLPPLSETHALVAHGYYVDQDSDEAAGTPSLRRKRLAFSGGAPVIVDEQIAPDIEDLQVEIGVDSSGDQSADFFVPVDAAIAAGDTVVAVRIWLMVRAEQPEAGFTDERVYEYANRTGADAFDPPAGDGFRRLLVSKTMLLRNTRR